MPSRWSGATLADWQVVLKVVTDDAAVNLGAVLEQHAAYVSASLDNQPVLLGDAPAGSRVLGQEDHKVRPSLSSGSHARSKTPICGLLSWLAISWNAWLGYSWFHNFFCLKSLKKNSKS
jgi:hypothetical protein